MIIEMMNGEVNLINLIKNVVTGVIIMFGKDRIKNDIFILNLWKFKMSIKTLRPQLFKKNDVASWKQYLSESGFVVIKNVLTIEEMNEGLRLFHQDWKYVSPNFNFADKTTWVPDNCPMMWGKGMIYSSGLGQSNFQWYLRTRDNIKNIWKKLHETDDLVVSFDGFSVFLDKKQKPNFWLHVDQGNSEKNLSIQGAYNFLPVTKSDSGFVVVPESHKTFKQDSKKKGDFIRLKKDDPHRELAVKLIIPANCFILWNSKTVHANTGIYRSNKDQHLNRLTSYISYFPKKDRSEEIKNERINGYKSGHNCSHWAIYHHIKKHPRFLKNRYENRNFNNIIPQLIDDHIPEERLQLI